MDLILQQRQELKLLMTAQLRQSIELLQYSTDDLEQFLRQQELENPLIELQEPNKSGQVEKLPFYRASKNTAQYPKEFSKAVEVNFRDQLLRIINLSYKENYTKKLLEYIINNLNNNGYLEIDEALSPYSIEDLTKGIQLLQQIGPLGIGARNIEECLLLQSDIRYPEYPMLRELIKHYLPFLAQKKWQLIAKNLKCTVAQVVQLNELIVTLNPKPCSLMQIGNTEYLRPDIIVEEQQGELIFYLNDNYLPRIGLNDHYLNMIPTNRADKQYINKQYKSYQWLVNSIEQRRNTISKIMHFLIQKQSVFFSKGPSELVPLTLKEVADEIEMHESTVSRATSNKYLQTPIGSFEFKSLFTQKIETKDGRNISQERVKILLKQLIEKENKQKPYSDQKIAEYFNSEHAIPIARRTISKYRVELNIPSASMRKQWN